MPHMPEPTTIAARIDLAARIRAFDGGEGRLVAQAAILWEVIEPEVDGIIDAYWNHWRRANPTAADWTPLDRERRMVAGRTYLRNRFCDLAGRAWVESLERSVAAAYRANVTPMELLSMSCASDRAALGVVLDRVPATDPRQGKLVDTLLRLFGMETEVTVELFAGFAAHATHLSREGLASAFRDDIGAVVEQATEEGHVLRAQGGCASNLARGMLGKTSEVAAAAEQSAVAMREAAQTAAGLIRAIEDARTEVDAAADIATRASAHAGQAVSMAETLSGHAQGIESILG